MENLKDVHISQFYPCSEVTDACEMYYICELGKYLFFNYNARLSIDGVILNSCLKKSSLWDYFRMAVDEGWVFDSGVSSDDLDITLQNPLVCDLRKVKNVFYTLDEVKFNLTEHNRRKTDEEFAYRTPEKYQVSFEIQEDDAWLWTMEGKNKKYFDVNNKAMGHTLASQCWVSLVAMVAVNRLMTGVPNKLLLKFGQSVIMNSITALNYIDILNEGNRCLFGWCYYTIDDNVSEKDKLQMGYSAWYQRGKDLGMLDRWYSGKEKMDYSKKLDIKVGDIVACYQRVKSQKTNYRKYISSCRIARVDALTESIIKLDLFNTRKTKFQGEYEFKDKTIAVKKMFYGQAKCQEFNHTPTKVDTSECGIEYMMHDELTFIIPLSSCDDVVPIIDKDSDGNVYKFLLSQNDAIYWILKDYGVEFNEGRFLDKYFKDELPAYTRFKNGDIPTEYLVTE